MLCLCSDKASEAAEKKAAEEKGCRRVCTAGVCATRCGPMYLQSDAMTEADEAAEKKAPDASLSPDFSLAQFSIV